jgi:hypothetical protein
MVVDNLILLTAIMFTIYGIVVSAMDVLYRDIKTHLIWLPLLGLCSLITIYEYNTTEVYPESMAFVSLASVIAWGLCMHFNILGGADAVWLSLISALIILTPSGNLFFPTFLFFLIGFTGIALFWQRVWNKYSKTETSIPYLAVISLAMIVALVVG